MKARIKGTNEIVECIEADGYDYISGIKCKYSDGGIEVIPGDCLIEIQDFDWQSFRAEAAKDILSKLITIGWYDSQNFGSMSRPDYRKTFIPCYTKEFAVTKAIELADELIKQLKEKEEK